jgi:hypothetical protein
VDAFRAAGVAFPKIGISFRAYGFGRIEVQVLSAILRLMIPL